MQLPRIRWNASWRTGLWLAGAAVALVLMIRLDLRHLAQVSELSMQGNLPPARDSGSPSGYVLGQRHFLGAQERGETFRWIATTQELVATGPFASSTYDRDTVPTGRPQLLPRLYGGWLAAVAWSVRLVTGESIAIAAERTALWEPVISHVLAFALAVLFMAARFGPAAGVAAGLLVAFFPPISTQFLPGVLTARTWALLLSAYVLALSVPVRGTVRPDLAFGVRSAVAAGIALWLDPAIGFPTVLLLAIVGGAAVLETKETLPFLKWALVGAGLTLVAWLIDRAPWDPAAGELRYVHPLYSAAWLAIGLALNSGQHLLITRQLRKRQILELGTAALLLAPLAYTQLANHYKGWLYASVWIRRITSLDEGRVFATAVDWLAKASVAEVSFILAPLVAAAAALAWTLLRERSGKSAPGPSLLPALVLLAGLLTLTFFRLRWGVVATLVALPLLGYTTSLIPGYRRVVPGMAAAFLVGLAVWLQSAPIAYQRPAPGLAPSAADLEALVHRHFSHWLASHHPGQRVAVLAPPELADSVVFHGGGRALMSTAWESYPGQLAATRILSALEATEAEAVLQSRELTHLVLPSWDKVLPLFVQTPNEAGKETLHARLQRWLYPAYLRPIPYMLPPMPAFAAEKIAVFKVTAPQDEALQMSRLAEYFVEVDRPEPAGLVAEVLAQSYADDPNAAIARATVYAHLKKPADFEGELARLVADATAGRVPFNWDRRVQRTIMLALGRQRELARSEAAACLETATDADLFELTALQAYRLVTLARIHGIDFADPHLSELAAALGAEYGTRKADAAAR